ncbi:hypothetical protein GCM10027089_49720 [Nocardia thraciensis]
MTTQQAAIHVRGLEKSYKDLRVLRGVDFEVARGNSPPSTKSSAGVRISCSSPTCGACGTRIGSRTACSNASR